MRFRHHLPLLVLLLPLRLAAQAPVDSARATDPAATGDTLRAVELDRRDIFDPGETGWVARVGNMRRFWTASRSCCVGVSCMRTGPRMLAAATAS